RRLIPGGRSLWCKAWEVMPRGASEDVEDQRRCDLCVRVVELRRGVDAESAGGFEDAVPQSLAEAAEAFVEGVLVEVPFRDRERGECPPGVRVARFVEREQVVEGAGRSVTPGERLAEVPDLPERGDERGMAVLVVEDGAFWDPRRDEDR